MFIEAVNRDAVWRFMKVNRIHDLLTIVQTQSVFLLYTAPSGKPGDVIIPVGAAMYPLQPSGTRKRKHTKTITQIEEIRNVYRFLWRSFCTGLIILTPYGNVCFGRFYCYVLHFFSMSRASFFLQITLFIVISFIFW